MSMEEMKVIIFVYFREKDTKCYQRKEESSFKKVEYINRFKGEELL